MQNLQLVHVQGGSTERVKRMLRFAQLLRNEALSLGLDAGQQAAAKMAVSRRQKYCVRLKLGF